MDAHTVGGLVKGSTLPTRPSHWLDDPNNSVETLTDHSVQLPTN